MTPTTLVMPYYLNAGMLTKQFEGIASLPARLRDLMAVTIVDDGSPHSPARMPEFEVGCSVQIWRIDVDVRWNQDAARNIGAVHAETNWILLTDIDHIVPRKTWEHILLRDWDPQCSYRFGRVSAPALDPYKFHPNSWFMTKRKYEEAGGYDERFAGYYGTDADFRDRVEGTGPIIQLKEVLIRVPRQVIPDASTTTYLRKQPEDTKAIRRIKAERNAEENWQTKTLSFPFHRVHP